jgi:hypothetical protein
MQERQYSLLAAAVRVSGAFVKLSTNTEVVALTLLAMSDSKSSADLGRRHQAARHCCAGSGYICIAILAACGTKRAPEQSNLSFQQEEQLELSTLPLLDRLSFLSDRAEFALSSVETLQLKGKVRAGGDRVIIRSSPRR